MTKLRGSIFRDKKVILSIFVGLILIAGGGYFFVSQSTDQVRKGAENQLVLISEIRKYEVEKFFNDSIDDINQLSTTIQTEKTKTANRLESIHKTKKQQIEEHFAALKASLLKLRKDPMVIRATTDFVGAHGASAGSARFARDEYWNSLANVYDPQFEQIMNNNGWKDIILLNKNGDIVYSTVSNSEIGFNINENIFSSSSIKPAFAKISAGNDEISAGDFAPYAPIGGEQAAFLIAKVTKNGKTSGYIALQLSPERINRIVQLEDSLDTKAQTFLFGEQDGETQLRSNMFTLGGKKYLVGFPISSQYIRDVRTAQQGVRDLYTDDEGDLVIVASDMLDIDGLNWGIVSQVHLTEALVTQSENEEQDNYAKYIEQQGYGDLALIHPDGQIFYTARQKPDLDTNILEGKFRNSNLAALVNKVLQTKTFGIADFDRYQPNFGLPTGFIAQPVLSDEQVEFIIALQLPLTSINGIMQDRTGLGESGESYLVGPDFRMRSDSHLDAENRSVTASYTGTIRRNGADTPAVRAALRGETGTNIIDNYNGDEVLSAYTPIYIDNMTWALLTEMRKAKVE